MGKTNNHIVLNGQVVDILNQRMQDLNDRPTLLVDILLQTDRPELGGQHMCVLSDKQAQKALAYWQARAEGDEPLDAKVDGWLHSLPTRLTVVADNAVFYCDRETRERAKATMEEWKERFGI